MEEDTEATVETVSKDRLCHPSLDASVRKRMDGFMRSQLKWTHRELHDALLIAGLGVPSQPSLVNYFGVLHAQFGDSQTGFLLRPFAPTPKPTSRTC